MSENKNFHILKLEASNIKGIKAVVIEPEAGLVEVVGKNGHGKTSALDAIEMALRGKKYCPNKPIRDGEEKGEIILELGDHISKNVDFVVKRTFTEKGSYLKVTNGDGLEYKSSQGMLDALCGAMAFDPMEFTRMDAKKRSETLKKLGGLNFDDIEKTYKKYFDERTILKRESRDLDGYYKDYKELEPVIVPDISEIQNERNEAYKYNKNIELDKVELERHEQEYMNEMDSISELEEKIKNIKERKEKRAEKIKEFKNKDYTVKSLDQYDEQIKNFGESTKKAELYKQKLSIERQMGEKKESIDLMTNKLDSLKVEKEEMLTNCKLPIDGLDFINGDVSYGGIEFEQINMAEKIKISLAMAMALNPRLKIVRIMNGSLIDDDGMKQIKEMAEEKGFDIWIEKVSAEKTTSNSFLITEGELSE